MAGYLTIAAFKTLSLMPGVFIDAIETGTPGWFDAQFALESARMDSRLAKRYAVPFGTPAPLAVQGWLADIVTLSAYIKRGIDPTDLQFEEYQKQAADALVEIKEAADSDLGLFDLPLRADTAASGIARSGPRMYSEQSPYVQSDMQGVSGHQEDTFRRGTGN